MKTLTKTQRDYRIGGLVFKGGKPRSVCTSGPMREGWDDAYQVAACAAVMAS